MQVMYKRVAGLDVHKETVVACVRLMPGRKMTRECRTFATTTDGLLALLAWLTECRCTHVAMEATGVYWTPVWKILSRACPCEGGGRFRADRGQCGAHQERSWPQDGHERRHVDR
jgi:hypothetical protein